jgi:hypothetical protein
MNLKHLIIEAINDSQRKELLNNIISLPPTPRGLKLSVFLKRIYPNETFTREEINYINKERKKKSDAERYKTKITQDPNFRKKLNELQNISRSKRMQDPKYREKINADHRKNTAKRLQNPNIRKRRNELKNAAFAKRMQDPEYRKRIYAADRARHKHRMENDPEYLLKTRCRERFKKFIRTKGLNIPSDVTINGIGTVKIPKINYKALTQHIQSLFKPGMTWENRDKWHIDHIKPLKSFKYINDDGTINQDEINKSWSLNNLQPLWSHENYSKGGKWTDQDEEQFKID